MQLPARSRKTRSELRSVKNNKADARKGADPFVDIGYGNEEGSTRRTKNIFNRQTSQLQRNFFSL